MEIKIREARLDEAKEIYLRLLKKGYRDAYTNKLVIDLIKNRLSICLVALVNNKIIATLGARREGYKAYWLYFLDVEKKFQKKGIAKALMNEFMKRAKERGAEKIASDTPNKKFLSKFGFREVGRLPRWQHDKKDQIIMFRRI